MGEGLTGWIYLEEPNGEFGRVSAGMSGRCGFQVWSRVLSAVLRSLNVCISSRLLASPQVRGIDHKAPWVPLCAQILGTGHSPQNLQSASRLQRSLICSLVLNYSLPSSELAEVTAGVPEGSQDIPQGTVMTHTLGSALYSMWSSANIGYHSALVSWGCCNQGPHTG